MGFSKNLKRLVLLLKSLFLDFIEFYKNSASLKIDDFEISKEGKIYVIIKVSLRNIFFKKSLEDIIHEKNMLDNFSISEKSLLLNIGEGKFKLSSIRRNSQYKILSKDYGYWEDTPLFTIEIENKNEEKLFPREIFNKINFFDVFRKKDIFEIAYHLGAYNISREKTELNKNFCNVKDRV